MNIKTWSKLILFHKPTISSTGLFNYEFKCGLRLFGPILYFTKVMLFCRCGVRQYGDLSSSNEEALDGILGFGKANSSMISQLASSGKVKKIFAHCLNGVNGGGIFAIGHVVQPKVNMTPLLTDQYYSLSFKFFLFMLL